MFATECVERFIERDEFVIAIEEGNSVGEMRGGRRSLKREKSVVFGFLMAHESSHSSRFHFSIRYKEIVVSPPLRHYLYCIGQGQSSHFIQQLNLSKSKGELSKMQIA